MSNARGNYFYLDAVHNTGGSLRRGLTALEYLVGWGRATDAAGEPVSVVEYGRYVGVAHAQAYRHRACFLDAFPNDDIATTWAHVRRHLTGHEGDTIRSQAVFVGMLRRSKGPQS